MEKEDFIYQPHQTFETELKRQYHDTAVDFFEDLVRKTGTDAETNRLHVGEYRKAEAVYEAAQKKWGNLKGLRTMFIVFTVIAFVVSVILITIFIANTAQWGFIVGGVGGLALCGLSIWGIASFNKKAKNQKAGLEPLESEMEAKLALCKADMTALNSEFDWNMAAIIMEKATPMIDLDPYFSNKTFSYLVNRFGFPKAEDEDTSVLGIVSGNIQGNPFILEKVLSKTMGMKTYTGHLTITWVEYVGSGKDRHAVTRSEVLTASISKECPYYSRDTRLIFGSDAAPNLSFSRSPFGADKMNAKQREKAWKNGGKELDKLQTKASKKGGGYTKIGNDEFEVFWGAKDRDNEVEFRYLFSPLAQVSLLELLENPEPYGDDFYFVKDKRLTSVASRHSQHFDYCPPPSFFRDYCLDDCRERFIRYCDNFIMGLYFDLAPILAIPAYQSDVTRDYIYKDVLPGNYNCYEHEIVANGFNSDVFRPESASDDVPLILKATGVKKNGDTDIVSIKAHGFNKISRVEYVSCYGGDGHYHSVPVYWDEYIPVSESASMSMTNVNSTQKQYRGALGALDEYLEKTGFSNHFERGFLALAKRGCKEGIDPSINDKLNAIFNHKE